ncbi:stage III sporulation protein AG [Bacillus chungangensis]|uniref:Stage III sporulation protein AG n=1 Tax=Bacillus chungangensis TaxID=587633 RepID=A0ABT9WQT0_9BACI|nr:stage III sporulation protein AG [Bacillus chungangensis]MDQ0175140.1 stage III sporulation protein AG [Bacillus chungangensis]
MADKRNWLHQLKTKLMPNNKKNQKVRYFLILLLVGIMFMLLNDFLLKDQKEEDTAIVSKQIVEQEEIETFREKTDKKWTIQDYEEKFENQLKTALEDITGVGEVTVLVNVEATERKVYESNAVLKNQITSETDKQGGKRTVEDQSKDDQLVIVRDGDKEIPIISETRKPDIKGVLIVAKGAEDIQVKKWIIEAVTRVLDVPSHKVSVVPKK